LADAGRPQILFSDDIDFCFIIIVAMIAAYLKELNEPQRQAVLHIDGPLLVLAGAGSGKTRVITHRIVHLIATGAARPDQVLGVTFTNRAAGEMKERVIALLGNRGRLVWLSTFHSLCARILRIHHDRAGYKRDFTIYDEADSLALIKRVMKGLNIPQGQPSPGAAQARIGRAKDNLLSAADYAAAAVDYIDRNIAVIYEEYQKQLVRNNALDFDDLIGVTVSLLEKDEELADYYRSKFTRVLVDEYQDTNHAQYRLIKLLAGEKRNLCVVGDDDQAIYGWRGADIRNILDFEHDFPGCRVITLEENYRSTKVVLEAAFGVAGRIGDRKPKHLFTRRLGGDRIGLLLCGDERDEAAAIAEKIKLGLRSGKRAGDFAVLYRTNAQSRAIEDALRDSAIPYNIVGGIRFYERKEVKDILAYLRLIVNPSDEESLRRIINIPKRNLGEAALARLSAESSRLQKPIFEIMGDPEKAGFAGKQKIELKKLHTIIAETAASGLPPAQLAAELVREIGYIEMLEDEDTPEADVRKENVIELVNAIEAYLEMVGEDPALGEPTLSGFLENVALITDIDNWNDKADTVSLMTLHSAKGLEFDTVFISGFEDGLLPLLRENTADKDIDEERRLCYVGITRAKSKLYLSLTGYRRRFRNHEAACPSRFLFDIPRELLEDERYNYYGDVVDPMLDDDENVQVVSADRSLSNFESKSSKSMAEPFRPGATVAHHEFGIGKIIAREGNGPETIVTVRFGVGTKKVMLKYANLEIIN